MRKAGPGENYGDVWVDTRRSMEVYRQWVALTRSPLQHSPDGTRRPAWLKRPLKPVASAYEIPEWMKNRNNGHSHTQMNEVGGLNSAAGRVAVLADD